jgi:hypothetical protein
MNENDNTGRLWDPLMKSITEYGPYDLRSLLMADPTIRVIFDLATSANPQATPEAMLSAMVCVLAKEKADLIAKLAAALAENPIRREVHMNTVLRGHGKEFPGKAPFD